MGFRPIQIELSLFRGPGDLDRSRLAVPALMMGLVMANRVWLAKYPKTPALYASPVLYRAEVNTENWSDIPTILGRGWGDCEDLACWRVAELRHQGIAALPYITWRAKEGQIGGTIYHALCKWPDGRIEDPSRALGMRHPVVRKPVFI